MTNEVLYSLAIYSGILVLGTIGSIVIYSILLKFASTLGIHNNLQLVRWSNTSKPSIGGIVFFIFFLLSITIYPVFFNPHELYLNKEFFGLIIGGGLAFILGLSDDAYNTKPFLKFTLQVVCAIIVIHSGNMILIFKYDFLDYFLTILWVVGIMNSINMLDNMDGITTVCSISIIMVFLGIMGIASQLISSDGFIMIWILAALIGFLYYNWHPSKMFMGDTGSQFIGFFLSFFGIKYLWNINEILPSIDYAIVVPFSLVLVGFIMPIIDTSVVTINRMLRGVAPYIGGKDHTTHSLSYKGISDNKIALIFLGLSIGSSLLLLSSIFFFGNQMSYFSIFLILYFIIIFAIMYRNSLKEIP